MSKTMEEVLSEEGRLVTTAIGVSMLPCIRPRRDIIVLERPEGPAGVRDVILYKRRNGSYVLHRIIQVRPDDYVLCGDNQYIPEPGIRNEQVLGILKGFYRGERYIDCEKNRLYRMYVRFWCVSITARKLLLRSLQLAKGICRRVRNIYRNLKEDNKRG